MKYHIEEVHIGSIRPGDTVEIEGVPKTVCRHNIKRGFAGRTLFGDTFRLGATPVKRLVIESPKPALNSAPAAL